MHRDGYNDQAKAAEHTDGVLQMKRLMVALCLAVLSGGAIAQEGKPGESTAKQTPDATLTLSGGLVGAGIGYSWGHGTLSYHGQEVAFCVHGFALGEVGAANVTAEGKVFNLKSVDDFAGDYLAISTGAAIARGGSSALLKNKHEVLIELTTKTTGLRLYFSADTLRISLAHERGCAPPTAQTPVTPLVRLTARPAE
jgi:hypothetical protein